MRKDEAAFGAASILFSLGLKLEAAIQAHSGHRKVNRVGEHIKMYANAVIIYIEHVLLL